MSSWGSVWFRQFRGVLSRGFVWFLQFRGVSSWGFAGVVPCGVSTGLTDWIFESSSSWPDVFGCRHCNNNTDTTVTTTTRIYGAPSRQWEPREHGPNKRRYTRTRSHAFWPASRNYKTLYWRIIPIIVSGPPTAPPSIDSALWTAAACTLHNWLMNDTKLLIRAVSKYVRKFPSGFTPSRFYSINRHYNAR